MYSGSFSTEMSAALFYDRLAIVFKGKKARTNYDYTAAEVRAVLHAFKSKHAHLCSVSFGVPRQIAAKLPPIASFTQL